MTALPTTLLTKKTPEEHLAAVKALVEAKRGQGYADAIYYLTQAEREELAASGALHDLSDLGIGGLKAFDDCHADPTKENRGDPDCYYIWLKWPHPHPHILELSKPKAKAPKARKAAKPKTAKKAPRRNAKNDSPAPAKKAAHKPNSKTAAANKQAQERQASLDNPMPSTDQELKGRRKRPAAQSAGRPSTKKAPNKKVGPAKKATKKAGHTADKAVTKTPARRRPKKAA